MYLITKITTIMYFIVYKFKISMVFSQTFSLISGVGFEWR